MNFLTPPLVFSPTCTLHAINFLCVGHTQKTARRGLREITTLYAMALIDHSGPKVISHPFMLPIKH